MLTIGMRWKLRAVMADKRITAKDLAETMGVSRQTIQEWKASDLMPAFREVGTFERLVKALECKASDLIED